MNKIFYFIQKHVTYLFSALKIVKASRYYKTLALLTIPGYHFVKVYAFTMRQRSTYFPWKLPQNYSGLTFASISGCLGFT